jgi:hypothetical protein
MKPKSKASNQNIDADDNLPGQVLTKILNIGGQSLEVIGAKRIDDNRS